METFQSLVHSPESTLYAGSPQTRRKNSMQVPHRPAERVHKNGLVQTLIQVTYGQPGAQNSMKNEGAMTE